MAGLIYKTKGAAKEYARLGLNIYKGCTHGCIYCYAPAILRKTKAVYFADADPKCGAIEALIHEAAMYSQMDVIPEIMLSFIGDPYQPAEVKYGHTRSVIKILMDNQLPFAILTKGGKRAQRDFDLLPEYNNCRFGTSLSFFSQRYADKFEPGAAPISDRIETLIKAKLLGIKTWVSLEPVIIPEQALRLINLLHDVVDFWAIGKVRHEKALDQTVDWAQFLIDVEEALTTVGAKYYIKTALEQYRGTTQQMDGHHCSGDYRHQNRGMEI
jgi:DNA repair photolyase